MRTTRNRRPAARARLLAVASGAVIASWVLAATAQDLNQGTARAAIRSSGNACQHVVEMKRSGDEPPAWIVRCNSGRFAVTANADSTFTVVALD